VNAGFRPEILELAVPALSKAMEQTLDTIEAATVASANGDGEGLENIEEAMLQPGAEGMRPSSQLAKLITALLWLNRTDEACESDLQPLVALTATCKLTSCGSLSIASGLDKHGPNALGALTDMGVSEALYTRADQACTRCIRGTRRSIHILVCILCCPTPLEPPLF